jgi:sodium/pantothenate symporter
MRWDVTLPLAAYLVVLVGVAYWAFTKRRAAADDAQSTQYYIGGRSLGWVVLVFTLLASGASAGTFIGAPGLVYDQGYGWVLAIMGQGPVAFVVLGLLGKRFAILSRKLGAVTIVDMLRHRYESPVVVGLASLGIIVFLVAYMVAQFTGGGRVIQALTGVPYTWVVVIVAGVLTLYTALGGFLADAVSDTIQGIIMLVGGVVLWVAILSAVGGMTSVTEEVRREDPQLLLLPGAADFSTWSLFSYFVVFGLMATVLPHLLVRGMSYRDSHAMHRAMAMGPLIMGLLTLGFSTMGIVARIVVPGLETGDLAVPELIIELLPGPLAGALLAAPLAAIMSTVDSMLLIVSATIVRDLYVSYVRPRTSDRRATTIGSAVSAACGLLVLVLALEPPEYLEYLVIFSIGGLGSMFFVPVLAGLYWRRGNTTGAILAMTGGLVTFVAANEWLPGIALGMDPVVVSVCVSGLLYLVGVLAGPAPPEHVVVKFWGRNADVQRVLARQRGEATGSGTPVRAVPEAEGSP